MMQLTTFTVETRFQRTLRRSLYIICALAAMLLVANLVACSSDDEVLPAEEEKGYPITIEVQFPGDNSESTRRFVPLSSVTDEGGAASDVNRLASMYDDWDLKNITVWNFPSMGDQLYLRYKGKTSVLEYDQTYFPPAFKGTVHAEPTAGDSVTVWLRNSNAPDCFKPKDTTGDSIYDYRNFLDQDGTLDNAVARAIFRGKETFWPGRVWDANTNQPIGAELPRITLNLIDVCLMRFTIISYESLYYARTTTTVSYCQGGTPLASATFTIDPSFENVVFMAVPAGTYDGQATLKYKNEDGSDIYILGNKTSGITLKPGSLYRRTIDFCESTIMQ